MEFLNILLTIIAIVLFILPTQKIGKSIISFFSKIIPTSTNSNKLVI